MSKPYRTLFVGFLRQDADLSVGGSHVEGATDQPFSRDGRGWPTITGATLKGALVATARKIYPNLPSYISGDASRDEGTPHKSLWRLFTAHPENPSFPPSPRQGVGIRQDTGAAAEDLLYDVEVLPRGTRWWFCLEVDTSQEDASSKQPIGLVAERIALDVLREWQRGRCWIGRGVARGMGWMTLEKKLQIYQLNTDYIMDWPDSRKTPRKSIEENREEKKFPPPTDDIASAKNSNPSLATKKILNYLKLAGFRRFSQQPLRLPTKKPWHYLEVEGVIEIGERPQVNGKTYGIDALAVGGHSTQQFAAVWDDGQYLKPSGLKTESRQAGSTSFDPDMTIAWSRYPDGRLQPYIPGSSLRGTLRHALSRILRADGKKIRDPNLKKPRYGSSDKVEQLFGMMLDRYDIDPDKKTPKSVLDYSITSSALLLKDAYLEACSAWRAVWLQRYAGDEFTGGVYNKFSQIALIQGKFNLHLVIEAEDETILDKHFKLLKLVLDRASKGHIGLGRAKWQGVGWPCWKFNYGKKWRAGEENYYEEFLLSK